MVLLEWQYKKSGVTLPPTARSSTVPWPPQECPETGLIVDVPNSHWLVDEKEGFVYPFKNRLMMIDGIPNRPLYFYQKDIIGLDAVVFVAFSIFSSYFIIYMPILWVSSFVQTYPVWDKKSSRKWKRAQAALGTLILGLGEFHMLDTQTAEF